MFYTSGYRHFELVQYLITLYTQCYLYLEVPQNLIHVLHIWLLLLKVQYLITLYTQR
jgi:hypothetical protein